MQRSICFWWWCLREAVRGSCAFANDWQWIIGFPVTAGIIWALNKWLGEGAVMLLSQDTALGAVEAAGIAFVITWVLAVLRGLLRVPAQFFFAEQDRANAFETRLTPRVHWDFDPNREACMPSITTGAKIDDCRYVRILPVGEAEIQLSFIAQLLRVYYRRTEQELWSSTEFDETHELQWSNTLISLGVIEKGRERYIDVCVISAKTNKLYPCLCIVAIPIAGTKITRTVDTFERDGFYRFDIALSGEGAPEPISLQVEQTGRWDTTQARVLAKEELGVIDVSRKIS